ncbi:MAG: DUF4352 domain-containing protein [Ktedonobacteraceae bacterium]|nr:DUF4352 domain-containing protein [Ktedonobacteraceae bacterium]
MDDSSQEQVAHQPPSQIPLPTTPQPFAIQPPPAVRYPQQRPQRSRQFINARNVLREHFASTDPQITAGQAGPQTQATPFPGSTGSQPGQPVLYGQQETGGQCGPQTPLLSNSQLAGGSLLSSPLNPQSMPGNQGSWSGPHSAAQGVSTPYGQQIAGGQGMPAASFAVQSQSQQAISSSPPLFAQGQSMPGMPGMPGMPAYQAYIQLPSTPMPTSSMSPMSSPWTQWQAQPMPQTRQSFRRTSRRKAPVIVGVLVALLLVAGTGVGLLLWLPGSPFLSLLPGNTGQHMKIGQSATIAQTWQVVVDNAQASPGNNLSKPPGGKVYLVISLSLKNISSGEQVVSSILAFVLQDNTGHEYYETMTTFTQHPAGKIAPGAQSRGTIAYEVPLAQRQFLLAFSPSPSSSGRVLWDVNL